MNRKNRPLVFLNIYPSQTMARYLLSSYILKGYLLDKKINRDMEIINVPVNADVQNIIKKIEDFNPEIVVYSTYIWNIEKIKKIVDGLKSKVITVLGGPEISPETIKSYDRLSDYYIIGEGEKKLFNFLRFIDTNDKGFLEGIAYYNDNNVLVYEKNDDSIKNLDDIPSIYLNEVIEDRLYASQQAFLETQRGCRFRCKYCVYPKFLPTIRYYSLERIKKELEFLIIEKKIKALRIFDAIFTSELERAKNIVRFLIEIKKKTNLDLPWIYWEFNYDTVDKEFLELTAKLKTQKKILNSDSITPLDKSQHYNEMLQGYTAINCVGIQTLNRESQKAVGRMGILDDKFNKFMKNVNELNLVLKIDIILGLPLETLESYFNGLEKIIPYLKDTDNILNIHRLEILPGTELETLCDKFNIKYSINAPHDVHETGTIDEKEMIKATKLTAILFRIINSPLRKLFFNSMEKAETSLQDFLDELYDKIKAESSFEDIKLVKDDYIDEYYWNDKVFSDLSSVWLTEKIKKL